MQEVPLGTAAIAQNLPSFSAPFPSLLGKLAIILSPLGSAGTRRSWLCPFKKLEPEEIAKRMDQSE